MEDAGNTLNKVLKGVTPIGDFWMMRKLRSEMNITDVVMMPTSKELLKACLTINRFKSLNKTFRSMDIVKQIQVTLKGDFMNRNMIRDIEFLNFMSKGDVFMDFIQFRNEKIVEAKRKANEGDKGDEVPKVEDPAKGKSLEV